ncbi:sec-independent translocase [Kitasatospora kifunensis]|uniref:Sec-independent protein translocase protein TatB n=1 Tax=Kitasatospora kifunensis TaxID=58351 RepID=A0A7W7VVB0_KITKI|nr:sec-independent translocase [Kitasatospora kifunensis]MBB4923713.1 sec-independent protein translocase protein TatB [Kitasatospora kifunensis]
MFFDIGPLELITLIVMAIVIFGPDKLPKLIQDATGFIRKVRSFADSAKEDIRSELGPEFKDFEFEDLNPKTFVRKTLVGGEEDPLGLKDLREGLDLKSVIDGRPMTGTVNTTKTPAAAGGVAPRTVASGPPLAEGERPPFDLDAT